MSLLLDPQVLIQDEPTEFAITLLTLPIGLVFVGVLVVCIRLIGR